MATPPSRPPESPFCGTLGFRAPRTTLGHSFLFYSLHCAHPSPKRSFFIQYLPFPLGMSNLRAGFTASRPAASPVSEGLTHSRCSGTGAERMNLGLSPGFWFLLCSLCAAVPRPHPAPDLHNVCAGISVSSSVFQPGKRGPVVAPGPTSLPLSASPPALTRRPPRPSPEWAHRPLGLRPASLRPGQVSTSLALPPGV